MSDRPRAGEVWSTVVRRLASLIAPYTRTVRGLASEVALESGDDPIHRRNAVNLDSVESVSVALLVERIGRLSELRMRVICAELEVATDCR